MNRDDIIRLAREADSGFEGGPDADGTLVDSLIGLDAIERFAALVEAEAVRKEREACAKVIDEIAARRERTDWWVLRDAAFQIRNRREKE